MKSATSLGNVVAAVMISGALPALVPLADYEHVDSVRTIENSRLIFSAAQTSFALAGPVAADIPGIKILSSRMSNSYIFRPGGSAAATPQETDADTTLATRSSIAGPVALAAIGALLVAGGLVSLSRRLPKDKEDERS